jgi:hypothetical protein
MIFSTESDDIYSLKRGSKLLIMGCFYDVCYRFIGYTDNPRFIVIQENKEYLENTIYDFQYIELL